MNPQPLPTLLAAARGRLWRGQFVAAVRSAAWLTAAVMLLAGAVHLGTSVLPVATGPVIAALGWAAWLAWAAWRRPTDADCALWADRRLGGASAYGTLLEMQSRRAATLPVTASASAPTSAALQLERWAAAQVPAALERLAAEQPPLRLARPLLAMAVCSALSLVALRLAEPAPAAQPVAAAPASASASASAASPIPDDRPLALAAVPATTQLAREVATALQSPADSAQGREAGDSPSAAGAEAGRDDKAAAPPSTANGASPAGTTAPGAPRPGATAAPATTPPNALPTATAGAVTGRSAGDAADSRADVGRSRALQGALAVQRSPTATAPAGTERRADAAQAGRYDDAGSTPPAAAAVPALAVLPATPPPATAETRLSPTETSYVQAWMKAATNRR